jgi:ribA/ribD-fused uncharacterized protein
MHNFKQKVPGHFENDQYVFFWAGPFSNWHPCKYRFNDLEFNCSEQQFIAHKAILFDDKAAFNAVMNSDDPAVQKRAGRLIENFDQTVWDQNKVELMQLAVYLKFSQNEDLKKILLDTGDKILVEASPYDKIWGIGMGADHKDILDESKWNGENLLGKVLMEVRDLIREDIVQDLES